MKIHECTSPMRCLGQGIEEYKKLVPAAMNFGLTPVEIKEMVYQAVAYLGIGRVFPFLEGSGLGACERDVKRICTGATFGYIMTCIRAIMNGTLNYYSEQTDHIDIDIKGDQAVMTGNSRAFIFLPQPP